MITLTGENGFTLKYMPIRGNKMVCGIGYIKDIIISKEIRPYYTRWRNMIERCYNKKSINYKKYGAKGVTVSNDWLCFDNFYKDIKELDGFDETLFLQHKIQLDKDSKIKGNKIYSKETCVFLTNEENSRLGYEQQIKLIEAKNEVLGIIEVGSQRAISRKYNLTLTNVNRCLKGKQKQHKGWSINYL